MSARKKVEVAAAVIMRADGQFLLGQRASDTVYAGYWEFPGGKVEPGESAHDALVRELDEELGIRVARADRWVTREFEYEHAHVRLHFFIVREWVGEPQSRIHASLSWQQAAEPTVSPMLPANAPVLRALQMPRVYGITEAHAIGMEAQLRLLDAGLAAGLGMVQLREGAMAAGARLEFAREVRARTRRCGALLLVNGDAALAHEISADGLHLPSRDLMRMTTRPAFDWVGASTHNASELLQAARLGLDFVVLGPVCTTQSHPGVAGMGWARFSELITDYPLPVLAIGGMDAQTLRAAEEAGAHGIAGIRGVWER